MASNLLYGVPLHIRAFTLGWVLIRFSHLCRTNMSRTRIDKYLIQQNKCAQGLKWLKFTSSYSSSTLPSVLYFGTRCCVAFLTWFQAPSPCFSFCHCDPQIHPLCGNFLKNFPSSRVISPSFYFVAFTSQWEGKVCLPAGKKKFLESDKVNRKTRWKLSSIRSMMRVKNRGVCFSMINRSFF